MSTTRQRLVESAGLKVSVSGCPAHEAIEGVLRSGYGMTCEEHMAAKAYYEATNDAAMARLIHSVKKEGEF